MAEQRRLISYPLRNARIGLGALGATFNALEPPYTTGIGSVLSHWKIFQRRGGRRSRHTRRCGRRHWVSIRNRPGRGEMQPSAAAHATVLLRIVRCSAVSALYFYHFHWMNHLG